MIKLCEARRVLFLILFIKEIQFL